jgi:S1-C subfamily serine protease
MKKLLAIVVLGLLFSGNAYALNLSCIDHSKLQIAHLDEMHVDYGAIDIIIDQNGSIHITQFGNFVLYEDVFTKKYFKEVKAIPKVKRRDFTTKVRLEANPLIKNKEAGTKKEIFSSIAFKAGNKIRTNFIEQESPTSLEFVKYFEIDLDKKTVKEFLTVTPRSKREWNSNWNEDEAKELGAKKIGAPSLTDSYINCKTSSGSSSDGDVASSGSGFFINNKGYFITNNHVVKGCKQSKITFKEESVDAEVVATDQTLDLALLKAKVKPRNYLNLSDDPPEKLQKIYVAGYPFGKGLSDDLKLTQGIISSVKGYGDNSNQIQIDAAINSGNSGGPIVDEDGDLVGVAVSGLNKSKAEGIAFGIKSAAVKNFLDVNKIKYSTSSLMNFGMSNKKLNNLLEDSAVYTFCN